MAQLREKQGTAARSAFWAALVGRLNVPSVPFRIDADADPTYRNVKVVAEYPGRHHQTFAATGSPLRPNLLVELTHSTVKLGGYALAVSFEKHGQHSGGGLVVALGRDEFLFAGIGLTITFTPTRPGDPIAGILSAEKDTARFRPVGSRPAPQRR